MNAKTIRNVATWLLLAGAAGTQAGGSANYNVPADVVSAGGGRSTSANYSMDSSIGGIAGLSSSTNAVAKQGFIGQLYEVAGLSLAAAPTTVNEGGTRQATAVAVLDDATFLALAGTNVQWSLSGWPLSSVDAAGLVTAGLVYQDTAGTVRGAYQSKTNTLALTVLDTIPDNFGSYAGDLLSDSWQVMYFGVGNSDAAPLKDPDGDGQNNKFENVANTVPTNAASHFNLTVANAGANVRAIAFSPRFADRTYTPEFNTNLVAGGGWSAWTGPLSDNGDIRTVTDTNAVQNLKFYRVNISAP